MHYKHLLSPIQQCKRKICILYVTWRSSHTTSPCAHFYWLLHPPRNSCYAFPNCFFFYLFIEGLTPPTTPPYKPAEEDLYKPEISQDSVNNNPSITSPVKMGETEKGLFLNRRLSKKQPERTELFAHLSKTSSIHVNPPPQGIKRPFSRSFGDHDYCQVKKPEPAFQRKAIKSSDLSGYDDRKHTVPPVLQRKMSSDKEDSKLLKDHEIRASLTKHFGSPDNTLKEEEDNVTCTSPEYDSAFEDSESECNSPEDDICLSPLRKKSYNRRSPPSKLQSYPRNQAITQIIRTPDNKRSQRYNNHFLTESSIYYAKMSFAYIFSTKTHSRNM